MEKETLLYPLASTRKSFEQSLWTNGLIEIAEPDHLHQLSQKQPSPWYVSFKKDSDVVKWPAHFIAYYGWLKFRDRISSYNTDIDFCLGVPESGNPITQAFEDVTKVRA